MKKSIEYNGKRFSCETNHDEIVFKNFKYIYVTRVINGSPAQKLGIRCGDRLISVNQQAPADADFTQLFLNDEDIHYIFYRHAEKLMFRVCSASVSLGVLLEHTSEQLIDLCEEIAGEPEYLDMLWKRGDWQGLLQASEAVQIKNSWFLRLIMMIRRYKYEGPAILMAGIALYELDEKQKGLEIIRLYYDNYLSNGTINFHALCFYYLGLAEHEQGHIEQAFNFWYESEHHCTCLVLQAKLHALGVQGSIKYPWQNRQFPIDFRLPTLEQPTEHVQLNEALAQLQPRQFLFVVGLPWYRANYPLNNDMLEYEKLVQNFALNCGPFYVCTDVNGPPKQGEHELEIEKQLIAKGLPIKFLYDGEGILLPHLRQKGSPHVYVLNKQGMVVNKPGGDFWADEIWRWLAQEFGDVFVEYDESE